jgi:sugar O-acyltransferase (sialic acid O-acetyltransferase NeuD family)
MYKDLIIVGAGGLAKEIAVYAEECGEKVIAFVCDNPNPENPLEITFEAAADAIYNKTHFIMAVGDPFFKYKLRRKLKSVNSLIEPCRPLVHPTAYVQRSVSIQDGSLIAPNCSITNNVLIDNHTVINLNCTVGHDTKIGSYCTINPGVNISGNVVIENRMLIGTGACIRERTIIRGYVGMGAVVTKSVPANVVVVGNPAKPMEEKKS